MKDEKIVLLIDAENTSARYAKLIVDYLEERGDIICARIYGDFINNVSVKGWNSVAIEYEMEQKQQLTTSAGKNSSDIALVIDAMDLLYQKNINTLCIVTSDGDFTGLVKRIREDGIEVIGIGKADASKRLEKVCDQYLDFDELAEKAAGKDAPKAENWHADKESDKKKEKEVSQKDSKDKEAGKKSGKKQEKKTKEKQGREGKEKKNAEKKASAKADQKKPQAEDVSGEKNKTEKKEKSDSRAVKAGKVSKDRSANSGNSMKVGTRKSVWGSIGKAEKPKEGQASDGEKDAGIKTAVNSDREKLGEIKTAIHEMIQQEEKNGKHAELGGIKSQLQMKYPGFDEKEYGYKTIRELINAETKFQVVLEGRHTYVVPEKLARDIGLAEGSAAAAQEPKKEEKKKMGISLRGFMPKKKKDTE